MSIDLDAETVNRIMEALLNDPRTKQAAIEVHSRSGLVTLAGNVPAATVRQAAEEIARRQPGVLNLVNDLAVAHTE